MQRLSADLIVRSGKTLVKFSLVPSDPGAGILSADIVDNTLHHPETGHQVKVLEDTLSDNEWTKVIDEVNLLSGRNADPHVGRII